MLLQLHNRLEYHRPFLVHFVPRFLISISRGLRVTVFLAILEFLCPDFAKLQGDTSRLLYAHGTLSLRHSLTHFPSGYAVSSPPPLATTFPRYASVLDLRFRYSLYSFH